MPVSLLASRGLALVAYLIFFSVQISFRYTSTQSMDLDAYSSIGVQHQMGHPASVHTTQQHPVKHILNKRYQLVDAIPVPDLSFPLVRPEYSAERVYRLVDEQPVQSDHIVALLRGPPTHMV